MATLHLVCGVPGAGKSTLARQLEQALPALRLTSDEWMSRIVGDGYDDEKRAAVEQAQWEIAARVLSLGVDVILESGFWSRGERAEFRARATALGASTRLYFPSAPREELWRRLQARNAELPPHSFVVGEALLEESLRCFEPPSEEELRHCWVEEGQSKDQPN